MILDDDTLGCRFCQTNNANKHTITNVLELYCSLKLVFISQSYLSGGAIFKEFTLPLQPYHNYAYYPMRFLTRRRGNSCIINDSSPSVINRVIILLVQQLIIISTYVEITTQ